MSIIVKATAKGQITLPASWRKLFNTNRYIITQKNNSLEIKPFRLERAKEYTVFDAIRDNDCKGIKAKDLVNVLKSADR